MGVSGSYRYNELHRECVDVLTGLKVNKIFRLGGVSGTSHTLSTCRGTTLRVVWPTKKGLGLKVNEVYK